MATKDNFFRVILIIIAAMLINLLVLLSVNFFGIIISIFILFTLPMTVLIFANVYDQLTKSPSEDFSQKKDLHIEDKIMESTEKEMI